MFRYIVVICADNDPEQLQDSSLLTDLIRSKLPALQLVAHQPGCSVFIESHPDSLLDVHPLPRARGALIGRLFSKEGKRIGSRSLDESMFERIAGSRGSELFRQYWGRYVAVLRDTETHDFHILRDPSGGLPCFVSQYRGISIVYGDVGDFIALGLISLSINWRYVRACLFNRTVQSPIAGLNEVIQVRQAERITFDESGYVSRRMIWDPLEMSRTDAILDFGEAVDAVRSTVRTCVSAWASCFPRIVMRYSAGFDSIVVLSCLRQCESRPHLTCLHYFDEPAEDAEREYLHRSLRGTAPDHDQYIELVEVPRRKHSLRLDGLLDMRPSAFLPLYKAWFLSQPRDTEICRERRCALFDGVFGNQLFFTEAYVAALDYFWDHPSMPAAELGEKEPSLAMSMLWAGVAQTARAALAHVDATPPVLSQSYPFYDDSVLREIRAESPEYLRPYWRQHVSRGVAPGKLSHISMMCMPATRNTPFTGDGEPVRVSPLISQPLLELFLRVPTYVINPRGSDRGVTREAFRKFLPQELQSRPGVDIGTRLRTDETERLIFRQNRTLMRALLLDGILVRQGFLNRARVERFLKDFEEGRDFVNLDLLEVCFDIEIWLQRLQSAMADATTSDPTKRSLSLLSRR